MIILFQIHATFRRSLKSGRAHLDHPLKVVRNQNLLPFSTRVLPLRRAANFIRNTTRTRRGLANPAAIAEEQVWRTVLASKASSYSTSLLYSVSLTSSREMFLAILFDHSPNDPATTQVKVDSSNSLTSVLAAIRRGKSSSWDGFLG